MTDTEELSKKDMPCGGNSCSPMLLLSMRYMTKNISAFVCLCRGLYLHSPYY